MKEWVAARSEAMGGNVLYLDFEHLAKAENAPQAVGSLNWYIWPLPLTCHPISQHLALPINDEPVNVDDNTCRKSGFQGNPKSV